MPGLFDGTPLERPVTCEVCEQPLTRCACPRDASGEVVLPRDQAVRVSLQKRRKGKSVTVVAGLDPVATDLKALAARLKSTCGAGGTVQDRAIEIQGDHREHVVSVLTQMGYSARQSAG